MCSFTACIADGPHPSTAYMSILYKREIPYKGKSLMEGNPTWRGIFILDAVGTLCARLLKRVWLKWGVQVRWPSVSWAYATCLKVCLVVAVILLCYYLLMMYAYFYHYCLGRPGLSRPGSGSVRRVPSHPSSEASAQIPYGDLATISPAMISRKQEQCACLIISCQRDEIQVVFWNYSFCFEVLVGELVVKMHIWKSPCSRLCGSLLALPAATGTPLFVLARARPIPGLTPHSLRPTSILRVRISEGLTRAKS